MKDQAYHGRHVLIRVLLTSYELELSRKKQFQLKEICVPYGPVVKIWDNFSDLLIIQLGRPSIHG